jgi:hypothetical protein
MEFLRPQVYFSIHFLVLRMREGDPRKVRTDVLRPGYARKRWHVRAKHQSVFAVSFLRHFLDKQKMAEENGRLRPGEVYVGQDRSVQTKCR